MGAFRPLGRPVLALALLAAASGRASAQYTDPPAPAAYALKGVTVVQADGSRRAGLTLVVRGGRIEALGPDVAVPADARVLEGDSLVVWPGLVDAQGTAKFAFPEVQVDQATLRSWAPPRDAQGFVPHRRVADALTAVGKDLAAQRKAGIVASAVHPVDGMMPGQGTLLLHRVHAATPRELVAAPAVGQLLQFKPARRMYPSTLFAITAFWRQAFLDAERDGFVRAASSSRGELAPAGTDPDYAALRAAKGQRVFFAAGGRDDIRRALALADEFGVQPVIVGGAEAWMVADELKRRNVPVLVSLDIGKPRRWKAPAIGKTAEAATDPVERKEQLEFEAGWANAGKLSAAGVTFALTTGGGKADVRDGVRRAMQYGLDSLAALRALTVTPATLLGVPELVRVAQGRPATFVVTNAAGLFGEKGRVQYTFVEGRLAEGVPASAGADAATAGPAAALGGQWTVELSSEQGSTEGTLSIAQTGQAFTGRLSTELGEFRVTGGTVEGTAITFTVVFGPGAEASFAGSLDGDRMTASGTTPFGTVRMSGRRTPGLTWELERAEAFEGEDEYEGHAHGAPRERHAPRAGKLWRIGGAGR